MLNMKPYTPSARVAVRESIDEDLSDDIEDDVFIRDGKSMKACEEKGLKRPLMAPRRRCGKNSSLYPSKTRKTVAAIFRQKHRCWKYCEPFCYAFAALLVLVALIFLAIFLLALFPVSFQKIKTLFRDSTFIGHTLGSRYGTDLSMEYEMFQGELTPCTQMSVSKVWSKAFSKLSTESSVRKVDISGDGIEDIVFGYGVDDSVQYPTESGGETVPKCELESAGYREMVYCEGGVLAMDGISGNTLWQRWTPFIIFSLYCNSDLNLDGQIDCVASGRGGLVLALNGKNGEVLWRMKQNSMVTEVSSSASSTATSLINLYTVNSVRDLDEDLVPDVLAAHVEERQSQRSAATGHISIVSGQSGKIIRTISSPYQEELYVPLQLYTQHDGTEMILVLTGGQNSPGGVYLIPLQTFMDHSKENDFITIFRSPTSGFMVPAILTDLNEDAVDDIVVSLFNTTVYAFNGNSYAILWQYIFPDSESISSIVPGHYNNDNITDFMIKYNCGPGFPIYYYSQTQIIDGKNGSALLDQMINDSGGANSLLGGISISQTFGGDYFLHWQTQCRGKYDVKKAYQFFPDSDILQQSRADTCMLRYNASTVLKLYAITRHIQPPGAIIFSTDDLLLQLNQTELKQLERQMAVSPLKHPKMLKKTTNRNEASGTTNGTTDKPNQNTPPAINITKAIDNQRKPIKSEDNSVKTYQVKHRKKLLDSNPKANDMLNYEPISRMNYEKPVYSEQSNQMDIPLSVSSDANAEINVINQRQKQLKNYILNNMKSVENRDRYGGAYLQADQIDQPPPDNLDEYPNYYDDNAAERKPSYATNNRDVRSKLGDLDSLEVPNLNYNQSSEIDSVPNVFLDSVRSNEIPDKVGKPVDRPETLWDLEMEKENDDAIKGGEKGASFTSGEDKGRKRRRTYRQPRQIDIPNNQNLLTVISSTGVLLKPYDNTPSSLDFVFILNVRESELYPPLLLPEDVKCVEDKLNAYQNEFTSDYAKANIGLIEKQFLKQCLIQRLPNLRPHTSQFESQIVVTRISITCSCGDLKTGEKCSTFKTMENQKWTEFMGNLNNGFYQDY